MSKGRPLIGGIKLPYARVEAMKKAVVKWQSARSELSGNVTRQD